MTTKTKRITMTVEYARHAQTINELIFEMVTVYESRKGTLTDAEQDEVDRLVGVQPGDYELATGEGVYSIVID